MQSYDYAELEASLAAFVQPGEVFEVRLLHSNKKRTDAGYFDHPSHAATAIAALHEPYAGIYFTPNPVIPDLAARAYNRINAWQQLTTMDGDIIERRWLLIDIDPDRPSGISSTDAELDNAFKVARRVANSLELDGWPRPYMNASGNGAHLLYSIREPNTDFVRDEISRFLKTLNARFKGDGCSIDTTVFNAARIFRLPGTWARKGDNVPTRPHRKAHMVQVPNPVKQVTLGDICKFNQRNAIYLPTGTTSATTGTAKHKQEYPDDEKKYRGLNDQAMNRLKEWVPILFPTAREYKQGYRVASADLGLSYEEDLAIHPWPLGIKYFGFADQGDGTEGRRMPIGLVAEFCCDGDKAAAALKLSQLLNAPLTEFAPLPQISLAVPAEVASLPGIGHNGGPGFDFAKIPNLAQLQKRTFKDQKWIVQNVLPTGNILLAARPKMRKTFLALQLALAVVSGRKFLEWETVQGDVLFLGLEDNERRIRSRIRLLQTFELNPPDLSGFRYWTGGVDISPTSGREYVSDPDQAAATFQAFPQGLEGVDALRRYHDMYPKTRLIVIDTLARFRGRNNDRDVYQRDYDQMVPITTFCAEREVCCIVVHHEKKGLAGNDSADFMEDVSGTSGITGAVDGVMSIKGQRGTQHENEERKLLLSGRDIPRDIAVDMAFDAERGGWRTAARQDIRQVLLELLKRHPFINQQEFCSLLPQTSRSRLAQVLTQMKYEGLVVQNKHGYSLPRDFKGDMI